MRDDRPSATAEMVCSWRAVEHLLPPAERIVDDPYARGFLGASRRAVVDAIERLPARATLALSRRTDALLGGTITFVLARQRAGDELLVERGGREQVVLLGAGYDTRSVRLAGALGGARLFEVDHPATAARKARLAPAAFGGAARADTVPVQVDFTRDSLEEKLAAAGHRPDRPTIWLWEGVSMYLEEGAVRATLDLVRRLSPPGSLLLLDVWCPARGAMAPLVRDLPSLALKLVYDEPLVWGPEPQRLEPLLREHGLAVIEDTPAVELVGRYGAGRKRWRGTCGMRLLLAEVDRG